MWIALVVILLGTAMNVSGATRTWLGQTANGYWSNRFNWEGSVAPVAGDRLIFPQTIGRRMMTNNLPANTPFALFQFAGDGYQLYGNAIAISNNIIIQAVSTANFIHTDLRLVGTTAILLQGFFTDPQLTITGDINLNGHPLTIANGSELEVTGRITGTGDVTKTSGGKLIFSGSSPNNYTGRTLVYGGQLELNKFAFRSGGGAKIGLTAVPADLYIGDQPGPTITESVILQVDNQVTTNSDIIISGSGQLTLNDNNAAIASLTMSGGRLTTGAGFLSLHGQVSCLSNSSPSVLSGRLRLEAGEHTFNVRNGARLQVNAIVSGEAVSLIKTNLGEMSLTSSNRYSGGTFVYGGTLVVTTNGALSPVNLNPVVPNLTLVRNGTLKLANTSIGGEVLWAMSNAVITVDGSAAWNGPAGLFYETQFTIDAADTLVLTGLISGPGGITKNGGGVLRLRGTESNTHTGTNRVNAGTLELYKFLGGSNVVAIPGPLIIGDGIGGPGADIVRYGGPAEIADTATVEVASSGAILLQNWTDTFAAVRGEGLINLGSGLLTIGDDVTTAEYAGIISGSGGLTKIGAAALTLSGTNTYTGPTAVSNGTLLVNGALTSALTTVGGDAALGGTGRVALLTVAPGGRLAPGPATGAGVLTVAGDLLFNGGRLEIDLDGSLEAANYDQVLANSAVELNNAVLTVNPRFEPSAGTAFRLFNKTGAGPVLNTFAGLPEGARFSAGGLMFEITYSGGDGNDVVITRVLATGPMLGSLSRAPTGEWLLKGLGEPGSMYTIEASSTLEPGSWVVLGTAPAGAAGMFEFLDAEMSGKAARFYRAR